MAFMATSSEKLELGSLKCAVTAQSEPHVSFPCSVLKSKPTKKMAEAGNKLILLALLFLP